MLKKIIWIALLVGLVAAASGFDVTKPAVFILPSADSVDATSQAVQLAIQIKYVNETPFRAAGVAIHLVTEKGTIRPSNVVTDVNGKASATFQFNANDTASASITSESEYALWQAATIHLNKPAPSPLASVPVPSMVPQSPTPPNSTAAEPLPTPAANPAGTTKDPSDGNDGNNALTGTDVILEKNQAEIESLKAELGSLKSDMAQQKSESHVLGVPVAHVTLVLAGACILLALAIGIVSIGKTRENQT